MENIQEGGKRAANRFCGSAEELLREETAGGGSEGVEERTKTKQGRQAGARFGE